jgi:hypothetical protein
MSNATHLAELEAAIAEADLTPEEAQMVKQLVEREELAIDEAVQAAIQTREQEPAPDLGPADLEPAGEPTEKQLGNLERENDRHLDRVRTIMGSFVHGFEPCNECSGLGLTPPGPKPQSHEFFAACEVCKGFGQVRTGSLRPGNEARDCPECKGRGYLEAISESGVALADNPAAPAASEPFVPFAGGIQPQQTPPAEPSRPRMGTPSWMGDPTLGQ